MINDKHYHQWKKERQEIERYSKSTWVQDELPYNPKPHQYSKEDFYSQVSKANSLTKSEFSTLFWDHLVHIGWRQGDDKTIVLVCQECDEVLFSVVIQSIDQTTETKISYLKNPAKHMQKHEKFCIKE
jgi:hypothetical protein